MKALIATLIMFGSASHALGIVDRPYHSQAKIIDVRVVGDSANLEISGSLPTACFSNPTPVVVEDRTQADALMIRLVATPTGDGVCIDQERYFAVQVNVPALVHASRIEIVSEKDYLIQTENYDFKAKISGSNLIND